MESLGFSPLVGREGLEVSPEKNVCDSTTTEKPQICLETTENQESNNIVIQTVQNGGSRDYEKRHNCYFCNTLQSRIARHLTLKHRDIKEIATLPDPSEEDKMSIASKTKRRIVLNKYRNLGNFCHNVEVLKNKKGVLFVGRRPKKDMCNKPENYLPCQHCFQFFVCSELWRHTRHCMFKQTPLDYENLEQEKEAAKEAIKCGKMLIHGATGAGATGFEIDNCKFQTLVLDSLKTDEVGLAIKSDELLILFGKSQFSKLGSSRASQVREKLRILASLKIILRARAGMCSSPIQDFIDSQHFDTCIDSVNVLADDSTDRSLSGTKMYRNPSIALKAGHLLKKLAGLKKGQALRAKDFDSKTAALEFLDLYQSEWTDRVSGIASQNLSERQFNRKEVLPITEDVMNLSKHLEQKLKDCTVKLLESRDSRSWRTLAELTLARLITFNKRRASEPAKMLVEKFLTRPDWKDANIDMMQTFTPLEKQLLNKMDLIEVLGKKNRKVPVLLTKSMSSAIEALISVRTTVGIPQENPYVFACGQGYLRGCEVLRNVVRSCNLKNPELITSTRMRKYMATVSQVFNLSNIELEEIARHMGHELTVHRKTYRLQEDVTELAKVSKLLLTVEKGMAHSYAGMSIDDIRLEDLDDFDEENSCREKPTDEQNVSSSSDQNLDDFDEENSCREKPTDEQNVSSSSDQNLDDFDEENSCREKPTDEQNVSSSSEQNLDDFDEKNSCQEKPTDEQNVSSSSDQSSVKPVKNKFELSSDEDDMDTDFVPTADTEDEDSSDSDIERKKPAGKSKKSFDTKKKREKQKRTRAIWSNEEKEIIKTHLLPKVKATRRPPQKSDVLKVTQMSSLLARKAWKHIKYQAWSFFQQEKKAEKKMINEMFS